MTDESAPPISAAECFARLPTDRSPSAFAERTHLRRCIEEVIRDKDDTKFLVINEDTREFRVAQHIDVSRLDEADLAIGCATSTLLENHNTASDEEALDVAAIAVIEFLETDIDFLWEARNWRVGVENAGDLIESVRVLVNDLSVNAYYRSDAEVVVRDVSVCDDSMLFFRGVTRLITNCCMSGFDYTLRVDKTYGSFRACKIEDPASLPNWKEVGIEEHILTTLSAAREMAAARYGSDSRLIYATVIYLLSHYQEEFNSYAHQPKCSA